MITETIAGEIRMAVAGILTADLHIHMHLCSGVPLNASDVYNSSLESK